MPTYPLGDVIAAAPEDAQVVIKCDVEGYECEVFRPILEGELTRLPNVILIESKHSDKWEINLIKEFVELGYVLEFEGDGNCLLVNKGNTSRKQMHRAIADDSDTSP